MKPGFLVAVTVFSASSNLLPGLEVGALGACHQERMANLLADTLVSPTRYMRAYLQQRGWRLPSDTRVIPNVMPRRDPARACSLPGHGACQVSVASGTL